MRWYWAAVAGIVIVVFVAIEFVSLEGFRPETVSRHDFGSMYFESSARAEALPAEVAGRCSSAKAIVEAELGRFQGEVFVWVAGEELVEEVSERGRVRLQAYGAEISYKQNGSKSLLIKVSAARTSQVYMTMLFSRARLMEISGEPATIKGPEGMLLNGLGYYLADPEAERIGAALDFFHGRGGEDPGLIAERDLRGWLIVSELRRFKGWSVERISKASEDEIKKELGPGVFERYDGGWAWSTWQRVKQALKKQ